MRSCLKIKTKSKNQATKQTNKEENYNELLFRIHEGDYNPKDSTTNVDKDAETLESF